MIKIDLVSKYTHVLNMKYSEIGPVMGESTAQPIIQGWSLARLRYVLFPTGSYSENLGPWCGGRTLERRDLVEGN